MRRKPLGPRFRYIDNSVDFLYILCQLIQAQLIEMARESDGLKLGAGDWLGGMGQSCTVSQSPVTLSQLFITLSHAYNLKNLERKKEKPVWWIEERRCEPP